MVMIIKARWKVLWIASALGVTQIGLAQKPELIENPIQHSSVSKIEISAFKINSIVLGETREVLIVLPASYAQSSSNRGYPLTIITDGEYLISSVSMMTSELARNGQIPESILVGIKNVSEESLEKSNTKRVHDLTPPGLSVSGSSLNEGGDMFLDFIEKELIPAVEKKFRSGKPRFFVGLSSGGVLATYAAATRSTYSAVVSLDAPIHLDNSWLAKQLIARASSPSKFLRYASMEASFGWPEEEWKRLLSMAPKTWTLYREKFTLEGHETMHLSGVYIALRQLFGDYSRFSSPKASGDVMGYYEDIGKQFGSALVPPKVVLENLMQNLIAEGEQEMATKVYRKLVFGYGTPRDSAKVLTRIQAIENRALSETVGALLNTPFPTPQEASAFIGQWKGNIWMGPNQPRSGNATLRIRIENGKVVGETIHVDGSGVEHALPWGYMKITPDGMWWGRLNDKDPKGIILFKGKWDGETLSGTAQFAGIELDNPPPPLNFSFKRVQR
jgi:predicted alpha/beta superfamily hydrolase